MTLLIGGFKEKTMNQFLEEFSKVVKQYPENKRWHKYITEDTGNDSCACLPNKGCANGNSFINMANWLNPILCDKKCHK